MLPCNYRGSPATHISQAYRCHHPQLSKKYCRLEGRPTDKLSICELCDQRTDYPIRPQARPNNDKWIYRTTTDLVKDALELCKHVPSNCSGICGIPRSGMMPAAAVATHMHLPLFQVDKKTGIAPVGSGIRFWTRQKKIDDGPLFVIDDSVHDGNTYWLTKQSLPKNSIITAVYAKPYSKQMVDHYAVEAPSPHLFEWNLFNTLMMSPLNETGLLDPYLGIGLALDFDGIISQDPKWGDDRSENLDWLLNLKPGKYIPRRCEVQLIATNRLEKWRDATDQWCQEWGVRYKQMYMSPYDTVEARDADFPRSAILVKGEAYKNSQCGLFVESDPFQAELIFEYTGRPVLCPQSAQLFQR